MDTLPCDIINNILRKVTCDNTPLLTYRLKYVNRSFNKFIDKEEYEVCKYLLDTENNKEKLYKNGNISIYTWLYENGIFIKYIDIFGLIKHNRRDILDYSMKYNKNINIIFNRFYLTNLNTKFNIFEIGYQGRSFFIYACELGKLDICKFFLNSYKNNGIDKYTCYNSQIEEGINTSLRYNNSDVYKYLIKYHIDKI